MLTFRQSFVLVFLASPALTLASPLYYSFEGTLTGFQSYNDQLSLDDFSIQLGQTQVSYRFMVDFQRDTNTVITFSWYRDYFYAELLEGGIVNGELPPTNQGYNETYLQIEMKQGCLAGGSNVYVSTSDQATSAWKVQDWVIGQHFNLIDGGYFADGDGSVMFEGDVVLTAITPEPCTLSFLAFGGLAVCSRRSKNK